MGSNTESTKGLQLSQLAQNLYETGMESWAKLAIVVTGSAAYHRVSSTLGIPRLFATAVLRKPAEAAMQQLLSTLNMPSRDEVITIAQRLTRIEMTLDDLGAVLETVRDSAVHARPAEREERNGSGPRGASAQPHSSPGGSIVSITAGSPGSSGASAAPREK